MLQNMLPITLTPFHDDGSLDNASITRLTQFYLSHGAQGLVVLGIMGEAHALLDQERESVIARYVEAAQGQVPVVATISAAATEMAIERARRAKALGAGALMIAPPANVHDPSVLANHFERIAGATDLPWVLQDEPVTTGVRLTPAIIAELAQKIPTLKAVKVEDVPTPSKIQQIHEGTPHLAIFGGLGGLYLFEELTHGAMGAMTGFSYPELLARIITLFHTKKITEAQELFYRYLPLIRYEAQLGVRGIAIRKLLYFQRELIASPRVRTPAAPADAIIAQDLRDIVGSLGLPLGPAESTI